MPMPRGRMLPGTAGQSRDVDVAADTIIGDARPGTVAAWLPVTDIALRQPG